MLVRLICLFTISLGLIVGCSQAPKRITAPTWDPEGFADAVIAKLDKNSDSSLDKTELAVAPGLAWGTKYVDTDKNGSLSRDELIGRFELYKKMRLGLTTKQMELSYKGRPVAGGKVTLVPEFFLEGVVEPATSEIFTDGSIDPRIEGMDPSGLRVGYYRVVVDAPQAKIPAKYAAAETTTLGVEVSPVSDDAASYGMIQLKIVE